MSLRTPTFVVCLLVLGCAVVSCRSWDNDELSVTQSKPPPSPAAKQSDRGRLYKRGIAREAGAGSRGASFITLESPEGNKFTKWSSHFDSSERATVELQNRVSKALEIVSREPVFDTEGHQIGEKVVARFSPHSRLAGPASMFWTEDEEMFEVDSDSVRNILEYRKDFNR